MQLQHIAWGPERYTLKELQFNLKYTLNYIGFYNFVKFTETDQNATFVLIHKKFVLSTTYTKELKTKKEKYTNNSYIFLSIFLPVLGQTANFDF